MPVAYRELQIYSASTRDKNGSVITGATLPSYITLAETVSDNGAQFSIAVSNSAGNVASNSAALAVTTSRPTHEAFVNYFHDQGEFCPKPPSSL